MRLCLMSASEREIMRQCWGDSDPVREKLRKSVCVWSFLNENGEQSLNWPCGTSAQTQTHTCACLALSATNQPPSLILYRHSSSNRSYCGFGSIPSRSKNFNEPVLTSRLTSGQQPSMRHKIFQQAACFPLDLRSKFAECQAEFQPRFVSNTALYSQAVRFLAFTPTFLLIHVSADQHREPSSVGRSDWQICPSAHDPIYTTGFDTRDYFQILQCEAGWIKRCHYV